MVTARQDRMASQRHAQSLRQASLFHDLPAEGLAALVALARCHRYARGEQIGGIGPAHDAFCLIGAGRVRLYRLSREGRAVTLAVLLAGEVFGAVTAAHTLDARSRAEAVTDGTVIYHLPGQEARRVLAASPAALPHALEVADRRATDAYDLIEELACYSLTQRLAHTLARLTPLDAPIILAPSGPPAVMATRDDLAALIGASREEVSRSRCRQRRWYRQRHSRRAPRRRSAWRAASCPRRPVPSAGAGAHPHRAGRHHYQHEAPLDMPRALRARRG